MTNINTEKHQNIFETLFEKSVDGVLIIEDKKNRIIHCNETIVQMLHFNSKDDLLNLHPSKLSPEVQPDGRKSYEKAEEMMRLAIENGAHKFEWLYARANGEDLYAEVLLTPITANNCNVIHIIWKEISEMNKSGDNLEICKHLDKGLKERIELALEGNKDGVWDWNLLDNSVYFSPRWKEIIGFSDNELSNDFSNWESRVHPEDLPGVMLDIQKHIDGKTEYYKDLYRLKHKDGHWVWILDRGKVQLDENGQAYRMVGTHTDITSDKKMELKYAHQTQIIEQIHDSVVSADLEGNIVGWNTGSEILFGYKADEIIGKHVRALFLKGDFRSLEKSIKTLKKKGKLHTKTRCIGKSGQLIFAELTLSLLKDEQGEIVGMIGYLRDITERKKAEEKLRQQKNLLHYQAYHDALTGLPNRTLFNDRLQQGIEKAERKKTELALFFIDVDRFKQINDSLGHEVGDVVLKEITRRLQSNIRKDDTLGRLGGDEFTILIEELTNTGDASLLAQKLLEVFEEPIVVGDHTLYVSSSIGISLYPQDALHAGDLLKYADTAMYRAKEEGRNNFQFYSAEMTEMAMERIVMKSSLRQAIDNNEFVLHYQPQVDAESNKLIGIEALIRWNHPSMGLLLPSKFLPLAEETGLIIEIDQWVMKTAMKQVSKWYEEGLTPGILALNLAVKQLEDESFLQTVKESIGICNFKSEWLELEVTEGQVMQKPDETIVKLNQLNDLGIGIAIDDFGTGYSSLSHLKRLPINKLKIDQSFVQDVPGDEEDVAIVKAIIALAKSLNLDLIAEGVETSEQKTFLHDQGCINIQGYYYDHPMPAEEMHTILSKKGDMKPATEKYGLTIQ